MKMSYFRASQAQNEVRNEVPTTSDYLIYTTANAFAPGTLAVYRDGARLSPNQFSELPTYNGFEITDTSGTPLPPSTRMLADYTKA